MGLSDLLHWSIAAGTGQSDVPATVVSAIGALVVAIGSAIYSAVTARRQVLLEKRLESEGKAEDARRDYEYDARKRLYRECEPLLFQARELAVDARGRITGLAIAARNSDIREDGTGWLANMRYYALSTCYSLFAPASAYLVVQRRLTDFDLGLEPRIHIQYELLRLLYASFSDDFGLAQAIGLEYRPDDADTGMPNRDRLLVEQPSVYRRQGLYRGTMSLVGDAFVAKEAGVLRCKTFSEFYVEAQREHSPIGRVLPELLDLVQGFHPARCPVLWLVFAEQRMLYDVLLQYSNMKRGDEVAALEPRSPQEYVTELRWRNGQGPEEPEHAHQYLANLTCIRKRVVERMRERYNDSIDPRRN